jgi:hypothetical protein
MGSSSQVAYCDQHNCIVTEQPCPYCGADDHETVEGGAST